MPSFERHHRVAGSDVTNLTLPPPTTIKRSKFFDSERLDDSKHVTYYSFKTLFTFVSVISFCSLYLNSPNHALGEFKHNSERPQQGEVIVQLQTPQLEQYHGRIVRIFFGFLAQFLISLSLLTMGFCKSRGTITDKNALFVILFLLLVGFTMWTFIEHLLFILSSDVGPEITRLLQDGLPSALHLLQEKNKCCRIIMMNKQQSPASGCRHVIDVCYILFVHVILILFENRGVYYPVLPALFTVQKVCPDQPFQLPTSFCYAFLVPNCTEMFTDTVSHQYKILWLVFLIHPIILIIFLYSNFTKRPASTPLKSSRNAEVEVTGVALQNGDDRSEIELHNISNESAPLINPVEADVLRNIEEQLPSTNSSNSPTHSDISQEEMSATLHAKSDTEISQSGHRADEILSQEGDPPSEDRFHSDNSMLSHRRPSEMPPEEKFNSSPLPLSSQNTKKNE